MLPLFFTQSRKFLKLLFAHEKYEVLGETPRLGKRFNFWFLTIDMYYCEEEPEIKPVKGLHVITWHVPKCEDVYENIKREGWYGPFGKYIPISSPIPYIDTQNPEYFKEWPKKKRRFRRNWLERLKNKELVVSECNMLNFLPHYKNSSLLKKVKKFNEVQMKELLDIYKEDMKFYLITDTLSNLVVGGMCYLRDRELDQIINQYSFTDKKYPFIGTGMLDFRIQIARKEGFKYINWGPISSGGFLERSWRGFTEFKLLFNPIVLYFRQSYFKISFNW